MLTFFVIGLSTGVTVLVGQYLGSKQFKNVAKTIGNSIWVFGASAIAFLGLILVIYKSALQWMNIPAEAVGQAETYSFICALGIPLIIGYNAVCAILRGMGDSKSPLIFVAVACFVNVLGDVFLTGVLKMDVAGVAISTVAAQGVSFIVGLIFLKKKGIGVPFSLQDFSPSSEVIGGIMKLGIPLGIKSILVSLAMTVIASIVNSLGLTASAAMGAGDKIINFAFLPHTAFSNSICVVVAQNVGAKQPDRARKAMLYGMATCVSIGVVFCLFCQIFPTALPSLFTPDRQCRNYAEITLGHIVLTVYLQELYFA